MRHAVENHPSAENYDHPARRLAAALIKSAIEDILTYERRNMFAYRRQTQTTKERKAADKANAAIARCWIAGAEAPIGFVECCEATGLSPARVRKILKDGLEDLAFAYDIESSILKATRRAP